MRFHFLSLYIHVSALIKSIKSLISFESLGTQPKQIKILEPSCGFNSAHLKPPVRPNFHVKQNLLSDVEGKAWNFVTIRVLQKRDSSMGWHSFIYTALTHSVHLYTPSERNFEHPKASFYHPFVPYAVSFFFTFTRFSRPLLRLSFSFIYSLLLYLRTVRTSIVPSSFLFSSFILFLHFFFHYLLICCVPPTYFIPHFSYVPYSFIFSLLPSILMF
jgi:hypothetical protein